MAEHTLKLSVRVAFVGDGDADKVKEEYGWFSGLWHKVQQFASSIPDALQEAIPALVDLVAEDHDGLLTLLVTFGGDAESPLAEGEMVEVGGEQIWIAGERAGSALAALLEKLFGLLLEEGADVSVVVGAGQITFSLHDQQGELLFAVHLSNPFILRGMKGGVRLR